MFVIVFRLYMCANVMITSSHVSVLCLKIVALAKVAPSEHCPWKE